jgi:hypothetical protein
MYIVNNDELIVFRFMNLSMSHVMRACARTHICIVIKEISTNVSTPVYYDFTLMDHLHLMCFIWCCLFLTQLFMSWIKTSKHWCDMHIYRLSRTKGSFYFKIHRFVCVTWKLNTIQCYLNCYLFVVIRGHLSMANMKTRDLKMIFICYLFEYMPWKYMLCSLCTGWIFYNWTRMAYKLMNFYLFIYF